MPFSNQELALIHEVASGAAPFSELDDLIYGDYDDLVDYWERSESVYKRLLSDSTISKKREEELERDIISNNDSDFLWDFDHSHLRHRLVAEMMSARGEKEKWFGMLDCIITKVFHYLLDDYLPEEGEPSKEEILLYVVKNHDYRNYLPFDLILFINMGIFDSVDADTKAKVLSFILSDDYNPGEDGLGVEDAVLAWIRRGLVSDLPNNCLQKLKDWVDPLPNKIDYMEAGLWHLLSTHERAIMIAPFLDKAETVLKYLPDLGELKTMCRLLRLEGASPLFQEAMEEMYRINFIYSLNSPNSLLQ